MLSDYVDRDGIGLSDHGQSLERVRMCTTVSKRPQSPHRGTETGDLSQIHNSYAPGYISLGKVRDIVPSIRTVGFSTKRPVKKVPH